MALWSLTKAEIKNQIETLLRRLSGKSRITYQEKKVIDSAINAAIADLCLDSGISSWRFLKEDCTVDTTSGTAYVDLTTNVHNVIVGTVRIESEKKNLHVRSLEWIHSCDPGDSASGPPSFYALDSSDDPETIRLQLWPVPDATLTIDYVAEVMPDVDSIGSFPSWMHGCLKDKSLENATRDLGYYNESAVYRASYEKRKQDAKANQGHDGPMHINRIRSSSTLISPQTRIP